MSINISFTKTMENYIECALIQSVVLEESKKELLQKYLTQIQELSGDADVGALFFKVKLGPLYGISGKKNLKKYFVELNIE